MHLQRTRFGDHPAGWDLPEAALVAEVGPAAVRGLHHRAVVPAGSTLVLVGDLSTGQGTRSGRYRAGRLAGGTGRRSSCRPRRPSSAARWWPSTGPASVQSQVRLSAAGRSRDDDRYPALQLANLIYGGYFSSRLVENIREDKGYTYSAGSTARVLARRRGHHGRVRYHDGIDRGRPAGSQVRTGPAGADPTRPRRGRICPQLCAGHAGHLVGHPGRVRLDPFCAGRGRSGRRVAAQPPGPARQRSPWTRWPRRPPRCWPRPGSPASWWATWRPSRTVWPRWATSTCRERAAATGSAPPVTRSERQPRAVAPCAVPHRPAAAVSGRTSTAPSRCATRAGSAGRGPTVGWSPSTTQAGSLIRPAPTAPLGPAWTATVGDGARRRRGAAGFDGRHRSLGGGRRPVDGAARASAELADAGPGRPTSPCSPRQWRVLGWHQRSGFCPRCGLPPCPSRAAGPAPVRTATRNGRAPTRRSSCWCTTGPTGCVLARQPSWPAGPLSVLAGFAEAGESLEGNGAPGDPRGDRSAGRRYRLSRFAAVAVPAVADGRVRGPRRPGAPIVPADGEIE